MNRAESSACPGNFVEVQKCNLRPCPLAPKVVEYTPWECSTNEQEDRYKIVSELLNITFIRVNVQREGRNSSERAMCTGKSTLRRQKVSQK